MKLRKSSGILLIILFSFALLFISGCKRGTSSGKPIPDYDYHTGTEGIVMNFVRNNPPDIVYGFRGYEESRVGENIIAMVEVRNKGAHSITGGEGDGLYLYLSGYDEQIIQNLKGTTDYVEFSSGLQGKNRFFTEGGYHVQQFPAGDVPNDRQTGNVVLPENVDSIEQTLQVTACYNYVTDAAPIVCIDPAPYKDIEVGQKPCRSTDAITGLGSQGAPVAVTGVEEEMMPGSVLFKIHIANVGRGMVIDKTKVYPTDPDNCPFNLKIKDIDIIHYEDIAPPRVNTFGSGPVSPSNPGIDGAGSTSTAGECEPKGTVKLINGRATIFCRFPATTRGSAYKTPLNIKLTYGYMDSISKRIQIRSTVG